MVLQRRRETARPSLEPWRLAAVEKTRPSICQELAHMRTAIWPAPAGARAARPPTWKGPLQIMCKYWGMDHSLAAQWSRVSSVSAQHAHDPLEA